MSQMQSQNNGQMNASKPRPMTLSEKILCHQAVGLERPEVSPGDVVVVKVARTLASELTWVGMKQCLEKLGDPAIWRNDRFFLAVDHSVDPRNYDEPEIRRRVKMCRDFAESVKLKDYFSPNESILHTEFYRQRAEPGTVVVGADSHSCAHGCVGAWATGMGAADVVMPLVTGQTWLKVPETVLIELKGRLRPGLVGKDVMLHILGKFGRNTVALDRVVEFSGAFDQLSIDSRFAISNMATEFGAVAGIFPADERTAAFVAARGDGSGAEPPVFLRADPDAQYAARLEVILEDVRPAVALWPEPDNVVLLTDSARLDANFPDAAKNTTLSVAPRTLDGVFIGACTTAESEIVLGALVLEEAMRRGMKVAQRPERAYRRQVTPGSRIMVEALEKNGILDIYRRAGFTVGAAGCSMCLGVAVDRAGAGEVWLSSQNRNFRNRMGKGAIGSITSAAVCAASSLAMKIADAALVDELLAAVDLDRLDALTRQPKELPSICVSEPQPELASAGAAAPSLSMPSLPPAREFTAPLTGRAQVFGDDVDTDAIIPAEFIPLRDAAQGAKSFAVYRPEFVQRVQEGANIVVAGRGFGCGSSREEAVSCLRWCGVQAVVARSFSFIFGRNLLSLDLVGVCVDDDEFYALATEDAEVSVDVAARKVHVAGRSFPFQLSPIQEEIYRRGGVINMYRLFGKRLFSQLCRAGAAGAAAAEKRVLAMQDGSCGSAMGCGSSSAVATNGNTPPTDW